MRKLLITAATAAFAFAPISMVLAPVASADQCDDAFARVGGASQPQFGYAQCEIDLHKLQSSDPGAFGPGGSGNPLCREAAATGAHDPYGNCPP